MSKKTEKTGSCLCQAVTFTATSENEVGACNCEMCRKWNGGPQMAISCGEHVTFSGEKNIAVYQSSDWAERGFCKTCGSHLFYRFKGNQHMMLAGSFDDASDFTLNMQYFIDSKPSFYDFKNDTKNLTGKEIAEIMGLG